MGSCPILSSAIGHPISLTAAAVPLWPAPPAPGGVGARAVERAWSSRATCPSAWTATAWTPGCIAEPLQHGRRHAARRDAVSRSAARTGASPRTTGRRWPRTTTPGGARASRRSGAPTEHTLEDPVSCEGEKGGGRGTGQGRRELEMAHACHTSLHLASNLGTEHISGRTAPRLAFPVAAVHVLWCTQMSKYFSAYRH